MKHTYNIEGMTCNGCVVNVTKSLSTVDDVASVEVNLATKTADITMTKHIDLKTFRNHLPEKFTITEKEPYQQSASAEDNEKSKLAQLKPLFLILLYIATASILIHRVDWNIQAIMTDFMGLFFIVFGFFKLLDIAGFATSFAMYDPIASIVPVYGKIYPFIETTLGVMLLMRYNVSIALIATVIILGFTTYGVTKTLLAKRTIKCACLGTALNLPMTEATFIENAIMIVMAIAMIAM